MIEKEFNLSNELRDIFYSVEHITKIQYGDGNCKVYTNERWIHEDNIKRFISILLDSAEFDTCLNKSVVDIETIKLHAGEELIR